MNSVIPLRSCSFVLLVEYHSSVSIHQVSLGDECIDDFQGSMTKPLGIWRKVHMWNDKLDDDSGWYAGED